MSFVKELLNKKKQLKSCHTVVTTSTGTKYLEYKNDSGTLKSEKLNESATGFVVDEKLDLQVVEIFNYLYLSSQDVAQDLDLLTKHQITHVLSIGVVLPPSEFTQIQFIKIDLLDEPGENLEKALTQCEDCINKIRQDNVSNKILVHCNAGYSRAPAIVVGYLIKALGFSLNDALSLIKEKRNVKPNDGFMKQLKELETKSKTTVKLVENK